MTRILWRSLVASGVAIAAMAVVYAVAAPRDAIQTRPPKPPAPEPSGAQSEPIDLNEGKSAAELFNVGCAVCHQKPQGLAKGRDGRALAGFLRQHYTTGTEQASALAGFLTSGGNDRGVATPVRATPTEEPAPDRRAAPAAAPASAPPNAQRRPARPGDIAVPEGTSAQRNRRAAPPSGDPDVIFLPPGATDVPDDSGTRRPAARPETPTPPVPPHRQRPASRPETAQPAESTRPGEGESATAAQPAASPASPPPEEKPAPPPRDNIPL